VRVISSQAMRAAAVPPPSYAIQATSVGLIAGITSGTTISMTPADLTVGPRTDISQFLVIDLDPGVY
jgi:hypothetical protein